MEIADIFVVNKSDRPGADRLVREIRRPSTSGPGRPGDPPVPAHHGVDLSGEGPRPAGPARRRRTGRGGGGGLRGPRRPGPLRSSRPSPTPARGWTELLAAIEDHRAWLLASGELERRRRARTATRIRDVMDRELKRRVRRLLADDGAGPALEAIASGGSTPYSEARSTSWSDFPDAFPLKAPDPAVGSAPHSPSRVVRGLHLPRSWSRGRSRPRRGSRSRGEGRRGTGPPGHDPVLGSRVSAELPLRTRSVQVLDRPTLESLPARSVAEALRWATGWSLGSRSPAQTDLSIRGGSFEQVLVLVDGVRMSDPQTGHFDLDLAVPLDRVERIEILRGPASAQYGSDAWGAW
jgi:hypothetical protein